jgi:hypothetical protein
MLINLSNHPSNKWPQQQIEAANQYGEIRDMPFPAIDPAASTDTVIGLAEGYLSEFEAMLGDNHLSGAVHVMGELTFCYALVNMLQKRGIRCVASTTERLVTENGNAKTVEFNFCRFREYPYFGS